MAAHETAGEHAAVKMGSERSFGFVLAGFFAVVSIWPLFSGNGPRLWAVGSAALLLLVASAAPRLLGPANRLWFRFGLLLSKFVSPVVMGLVFYLAVTPIAFLMRALGANLLGLKVEPGASSYWVERKPPGPEPESLDRQF